ncbi:3-phosphoshikimate 1-carboxyvinyltransferase [Chloroflexota bacterium]
MEKRVQQVKTLAGRISPPGDKSISHRAVMLNAIAEGTAEISNYLPSDDVKSTIACLKALGVDIEVGSDRLLVHGVGSSGLSDAQDILDARNSGTTMRLLSGLLAPQPFLSTITGDESLLTRPMDRVIVPLRFMGATIWGKNKDGLAPLIIRGTTLHGIRYEMPIASAQVKSAILLAALYAQGSTSITEPVKSRDHTERMLRAMGAALNMSGNEVRLLPPSKPLRSMDVVVPGDISAAAYWLVAGAIHPNAKIELTGVGVNPTRRGVIDVLVAMGAKIEIENERKEGGEPVADIVVESNELKGVDIDGDMIPRLIDEIPVLAVAAAMAKGKTTIRDAGELRVKESDRITTTVTELRKLGAQVDEMLDGMVIQGTGRLTGAECDSYGDHRLAMALGVAGIVAEGDTVVYNAEAVNVSYPGFWDDLNNLSTH